jgi:iron complex outermembrane receptor protein
VGDKSHYRRAERFVLAASLSIIALDFQVTTKPIVAQGERNIPRLSDLEPMQTGAAGLMTSPLAQAANRPMAQQPDDAEELEEVTVEGVRGYRAIDATTGTKIDVPLRDLPISITVIPRQLIEDRAVTRFGELADNVAGVQALTGYGGLSAASYVVRGFDLGGEGFRNGFRDFGFLSPRDIANVERVEFLKGPASVLYGGGFAISGLVNTITKKPTANPLLQLGLTAGNYGFIRPSLDAGGPLNADRSLLYRLNAAFEKADSHRDFNGSESFFVAPAIAWQPSPQTRLTVEAEFQNYNYVFDRAFPRRSGPGPGTAVLDGLCALVGPFEKASWPPRRGRPQQVARLRLSFVQR